MRSVTVKREVITRAEKTLKIPKITGFCRPGDGDDEICDCLNVECGGTDCDDCIFSEPNFEYFKAFMNDEKTV